MIVIVGNIYYIILVVVVVDDDGKVSNTVSPSKPKSLVEGDVGGARKSLETSKSSYCVDSFLSGAHATSSPLFESGCCGCIKRELPHVAVLKSDLPAPPSFLSTIKFD